MKKTGKRRDELVNLARDIISKELISRETISYWSTILKKEIASEFVSHFLCNSYLKIKILFIILV